MQIKKIPLNEIKPYWKNPRKISKKAIDAVAESIQRYGFNTPLILDSKNVIIAGHTRYKALLKLGYTEADCVTLDINSKKAKEYRLIDNKTHELTAWDFNDLTVELRELEVAEMEIFFPDLDKLVEESVGFKQAIIDDEKITKQARVNEDMFKERSDQIAESYIELICPACGETFMMKKKDVQ